ncbi:T6SS effector amidase Tae4 family protein [Mucilaginibacter antarcticus]|uniref:T6SS effector amidase Tae4 family protein n=1 Tax=Mucilaginibacter antarcticus TaxID=1855725 RepID=UPI00366A8707
MVNEIGATVIAVPTVENSIDNINVSIRRLYIFDAADKKVVKGRIVEFVGLNYSINKNLVDLIKGIHSQDIMGFNGAIVQYDLNYHWVEGAQYQSGHRIANYIALSKSIGGKNVYLSNVEVSGEGEPFFREQKVLYDATKLKTLNEGDATGSMGQTSELSTIVIPGGSGSSGGSGGGNTGGGGYGGPFPDPPPVGGSGGGNSAPPPTPAAEPSSEDLGDWTYGFWYEYVAQQSLPSYADLIAHYPSPTMDAAGVYNLIGGAVKAARVANPYDYNNSCALRLSRALNYSGAEIPVLSNGKTMKGADNKNYIFRVSDMYAYLKKVFGEPTEKITNPSALVGKSAMSGKGIYLMQAASYQQFGASGHVTLYKSGNAADGHDYLNAPGGVSYIALWHTN